MESRLLEILVCPLCKGPLEHKREQGELICRADKLAFPVRDGIPVMLENEARDLAGSTASDGVGTGTGTGTAGVGAGPSAHI